MNLNRFSLLAVCAAALLSIPVVYSVPAQAAETIQPRDGWYNQGLVDFEFVRPNVDIPPKKGVMIIDSRPAARQFDPGHISGAINIPDSVAMKGSSRMPVTMNALTRPTTRPAPRPPANPAASP